MPHTLNASLLLSIIADHLDIPKSYYERAAARHRSLGEWLLRPESSIAAFAPDVRPQGSFRFGTVVKPIHPDEEYDLDNVCVLKKLGKAKFTQKELKDLYGEEIKGYAKAHTMNGPVTEHNRCWRLPYADEVKFHLDTLPSVPEDEAIIQRIVAAGVPWDLARRAIAITDKRHPQYNVISSIWYSSNPRGFAAWFEERAALGRDLTFNERLQATVEDVPPYEWKTTLQRSIQILKRHRDVMFFDMPDVAPISMIITNLAARAYDGDPDLVAALRTIVNGMGRFVRAQRPRVPNPADPVEDYADKWARDPQLEKYFWQWLVAVTADVAKLETIASRDLLDRQVQTLLRVDLTGDELDRLYPTTVVRTSPAIHVAPAAPFVAPPKPWAANAADHA